MCREIYSRNSKSNNGVSVNYWSCCSTFSPDPRTWSVRFAEESPWPEDSEVWEDIYV